MTGRSIETRLYRLERQRSPSAEPVVFRTIYEGEDGSPESETIWWVDSAQARWATVYRPLRSSDMSTNLAGRLHKLELLGRQRSGLSSERRKLLTDRAVLHGDQDALWELNQHRQPFDEVSQEQRAAAAAAALRADS
jgi:hypothetical protein